MTSPPTSTSSIGGLVSGMDTSSIVSQLMQIESQPQTLLKTQLTGVQTDAAAYRDVNTAFAALQTAAASLTGSSLQSVLKAASTDTSVSATAGAGAAAGDAVTFTVTSLASAQTAISNGQWSSVTAPLDSTQEPVWPLTVLDSTDKAVGQITLPANGSLTDAAAAINQSPYGLRATIVQLGTNQYRLQVTSQKAGSAAAFKLQSADEAGTTTAGSFAVTRAASDAVLDLGNNLTARSSSNTFSSLLSGVSVTVSAVTPSNGTATTVSVSSDTAAMTSKVQALVTAANGVLSKISQYTDSSSGSTAPLKGDWSLISLSGQVLDAVSNAVGGKSAASAGLTVDRYGAIQFDASAFQAKLASDPGFVATVFGGTTGAGKDGIKNTPDDTIDVDGVGARLMQLASRASDKTAGILTTLANGQDTRAKDLQSQISDWDLRLQLRQQALTDQFNAMETALGTLKSQSSWLSSQIGSLYNPNASKG